MTSCVALLKACARKKDLCKGIGIHALILKRGLLEKNSYVASTLISMYTKCGALAKAQTVLDGLTVRNIVTWNTLIAGYAQNRQGEEALNCFEQMQTEGLLPDAVTFSCILKACGSIRAAAKGKQIHDEIISQGLLQGKDVVLGNALVDMYAKCGWPAKAQQVLDELPIRNVVSWSALIAGYAQVGQGKEALGCFERMQKEGLSPNAVTFACTLKACGCTGAADKGKKVHDEIVSQGLLGNNTVLGTALVDMYAKCGAFVKARGVLEELPVRDVVSWNALIAGYAQHEQGMEAMNCYEGMQNEGLSPDSVTFTCILKACGSMRAADNGKQIHQDIINQGFLGENVVLGTALVDMYAKCGALSKAQQVLDDLPIRNAVSWSAIIAGYSQHEQGEESLKCFQHMQWEGFSPNEVTLACVLKACGSIGAADMGKQVHDEIVSQGLLGNFVLGNALVDMYTQCGELAKAKQVLNGLPVRETCSWNVLIAGYAQQEQGEEALNCYERMHREGLSPDAVTFSSILKACGSIGAADKGEQIHDEVVSQGLLGENVVLGSALVDMYAKCGALTEAQKVLDELLVRNVISWNAIIAGYAQQVQGEEALKCFERMRREGVYPDTITFLSVLCACSRTGFVDEGQMYMESMREKYGIVPCMEHYTCMVDLFGRAGQFDEAVAVIKKMPSSDCSPIWSAMLAACSMWGNLKLGKWAFECATQVDEYDAGAYVCMANLYRTAGMHEDASKIEAMRLSVCEQHSDSGRLYI